MICLIAKNYHTAETWAEGQQLRREEWFCPSSVEEIKGRKNFHVIVIGTPLDTMSPYEFEILFHRAKVEGAKR